MLVFLMLKNNSIAGCYSEIDMRQKNGQNFLIDKNIANNIIKTANLERQDIVLEIGSGKGILTKIIQPKAKYLTVIEIDRFLCDQLSSYFSLQDGGKNIKIINVDFLKFNLSELQLGKTLKNKISQRDLFKIISNLPYNVGTAIIQKILPTNFWKVGVFMLQKEVAQRFIAQSTGKNYGYISIFASYYAECEILFDVSANCFKPKPKITSSVVKLVNKFPKPPELFFFDFVKHSFNMRRKTILNCLSSFKNMGKGQATKILNSCNLDVSLRPDNLSISDFLYLTNKIKHYIIRLT
jgi:16S rRNA (adenine1518-N6/adenine1519-N6)-dimethyltransferase